MTDGNQQGGYGNGGSNRDEEFACFIWQKLPFDVIENILLKLGIGDRVRMRLVRKSWRDVLTRPDVLSIPDAPWRIMQPKYSFLEKLISSPFRHLFSHEYSSLTNITFWSLSERRAYKFNLPAFGIHGSRGWLCGCSNGWLVIAAGRAPKSDMFLWNPLSRGPVVKLPPLATVSFYNENVNQLAWHENISCLIHRVEVLSTDPATCVVAVVFNDYERIKSLLAFCTPQAEFWTVFSSPVSGNCHDILFHNGLLYALFCAEDEEDNHESNSFECLRADLHDYGVTVKVLIMSRSHIFGKSTVEFAVAKYFSKIPCLVSSPLDSREILFISGYFDLHGSNRDTEGEVLFARGFEYEQISQFNVDALVMNDNSEASREIVRVRPMSSLGEQALFVANTGSLSIPTKICNGVCGKNCIHFAGFYAQIVADGSAGQPGGYLTSGVFFFGGENIETCKSFVEYMPQSRMGWFMPKL